jgi:long-chain acyl-CoA synthetase
MGYCEDPESTKKAFDNGWLRTGDAGYVDDNGFLFYTDRLQDMRQLADGTNFSPQYIRSRLKSSPFIKEAFIALEEEKGFIGAIINLSYRSVAKWAEKRAILSTTLADLSQTPEAAELLRHEVERVNSMLPDKLKIRAFINLYRDFDADEAEVTRTGKLRRKPVADRYKELTEAMFSRKTEVVMEAPVGYHGGRKGSASLKIKINYLS